MQSRGGESFRLNQQPLRFSNRLILDNSMNSNILTCRSSATQGRKSFPLTMALSLRTSTSSDDRVPWEDLTADLHRRIGGKQRRFYQVWMESSCRTLVVVGLQSFFHNCLDNRTVFKEDLRLGAQRKNSSALHAARRFYFPDKHPSVPPVRCAHNQAPSIGAECCYRTTVVMLERSPWEGTFSGTSHNGKTHTRRLLA